MFSLYFVALRHHFYWRNLRCNTHSKLCQNPFQTKSKENLFPSRAWDETLSNGFPSKLYFEYLPLKKKIDPTCQSYDHFLFVQWSFLSLQNRFDFYRFLWVYAYSSIGFSLFAGSVGLNGIQSCFLQAPYKIMRYDIFYMTV